MSIPITALREIPLFSQVEEENLQKLAADLVPVQFHTGEIIFRTGDSSSAMYIVQKGTVELFQENATGQRFVLERCGPGTYFGEASLLSEGLRAASALVVDEVFGFELRKAHLKSFLEANPTAALPMLNSLASRLQASGGHLRQTVTPDPNQEIERKSTLFERISDVIAAFSGSFYFLLVHSIVYGAWIIGNALAGKNAIDPFPFLLLAMVASAEGIFLSCFVLLSQNRQAMKDRIRDDIEYQVNVAAERQINQLHRLFEDLRDELRRRN